MSTYLTPEEKQLAVQVSVLIGKPAETKTQGYIKISFNDNGRGMDLERHSENVFGL